MNSSFKFTILCKKNLAGFSSECAGELERNTLWSCPIGIWAELSHDRNICWAVYHGGSLLTDISTKKRKEYDFCWSHFHNIFLMMSSNYGASLSLQGFLNLKMKAWLRNFMTLSVAIIRSCCHLWFFWCWETDYYFLGMFLISTLCCIFFV